jgi:hypothetical protein
LANTGATHGGFVGTGSAALETIEIRERNLESPGLFDRAEVTAGDSATDRTLVDAQARGSSLGGQEYRCCRRMAAALGRWVQLSLLSGARRPIDGRHESKR